MRNRNSLFVMTLATIAGSLLLIGCQKSSGSTVHTYEYSDQGRTERPVQGNSVNREQPSTEYQMTAPGQMAAPGEMVPPGRPVVEPPRNP